MKISLQAGQLVGVLYDALLKQYKDPDNTETLKSLNMLCVRLVFCLYAENAGIFGNRSMFHDCLQGHEQEARALMDHFKVLDTKPENRDPYMDEDLASFPYVNGGLFVDENIVIPRLDETIVDLILQKASADFDWSAISPTIFGTYLYQMHIKAFVAATCTYSIWIKCCSFNNIVTTPSYYNDTIRKVQLFESKRSIEK